MSFVTLRPCLWSSDGDIISVSICHHHGRKSFLPWGHVFLKSLPHWANQQECFSLDLTRHVYWPASPHKTQLPVPEINGKSGKTIRKEITFPSFNRSGQELPFEAALFRYDAWLEKLRTSVLGDEDWDETEIVGRFRTVSWVQVDGMCCLWALLLMNIEILFDSFEKICQRVVLLRGTCKYSI